MKTEELEKYFDTKMYEVIKYHSTRLRKNLDLSDIDAEDVYQDMAIELITAFKRFTPNKANIHTFAANVLLSYARRIVWRRNMEYESLAFEPEIPTDEVEIDDTNELLALKIDIAETVSKLPPSLRDVYYSIMEFDLSTIIRDISSSRSVFYRHICQLREIFEEKGLVLTEEKSISQNEDI